MGHQILCYMLDISSLITSSIGQTCLEDRGLIGIGRTLVLSASIYIVHSYSASSHNQNEPRQLCFPTAQVRGYPDSGLGAFYHLRHLLEGPIAFNWLLSLLL